MSELREEEKIFGYDRIRHPNQGTRQTCSRINKADVGRVRSVQFLPHISVGLPSSILSLAPSVQQLYPITRLIALIYIYGTLNLTELVMWPKQSPARAPEKSDMHTNSRYQKSNLSAIYCGGDIHTKWPPFSPFFSVALFNRRRKER